MAHEWPWTGCSPSPSGPIVVDDLTTTKPPLLVGPEESGTISDERWRLGRRPALDGLRGVGVLMVLIGHAGLAGPFNDLHVFGVEVFFVLSGFLITSLLLEEHRASGGIDLLAFYRRRARRLGPALVVFLAGAGAIAYVTGGWDRAAVRPGPAVRSAVLGQHLHPGGKLARRVRPGPGDARRAPSGAHLCGQASAPRRRFACSAPGAVGCRRGTRAGLPVHDCAPDRSRGQRRARLAATLGEGRTAHVLSLRPLRWTGELSYGLYLWHGPIYLLLGDRIHMSLPLHLAIVGIGLTFLAAMSSMVLVESRFLTRKPSVLVAWENCQGSADRRRPVPVATVTRHGPVVAPEASR